eukprot:2243201-Prymnesium_polylepis.1
MCTSSPTIVELFQRHAIDGRMGREEWLAFVREEQLASAHDQDNQVSRSNVNDSELARAKQAFKEAADRDRSERQSLELLRVQQNFDDMLVRSSSSELRSDR